MIHQEMLIGGHFIGGVCDYATGKSVIRSPWDGATVGSAAEGGWSEMEGAISAAHDAFQTWRFSSSSDRAALLQRVSKLITERRQELADLMRAEIGKPVTLALGEVDRVAITFAEAARCAALIEPVSMPLDGDPRGVHYRAQVLRQPVGPIFGIVPYNWPINLAAHKIAPALAAGATIIVKPSPLSPLSTYALARIIHEAGAPDGVMNCLLVEPSVAERAIGDPRVKMLSFTGSPAVGWALKAKFPSKRVVLELGGNASAIVCASADLQKAAPRLATGAFAYAGQICISVQHILVERSRYEEVRARLLDEVSRMPVGDPSRPEVVCGPMISETAAERVIEWVEEADVAGATVLTGGTREGTMIAPTILENVPDTVRLANEEVFGPVVSLEPFDSLEHAIGRVNRSRYGIHASVFTEDGDERKMAADRLEVGGVVFNDSPTVRFDNLPYGGVKESGFGREGVRYAIEEMTELKSLVSRID
ncbi:MAG: aldehyde dehydrogenase family protein [Armatimonadetes bacterium]|nr:aldehyde dehydrogenase family protein [Armatimonadota bacterium]